MCIRHVKRWVELQLMDVVCTSRRLSSKRYWTSWQTAGRRRHFSFGHGRGITEISFLAWKLASSCTLSTLYQHLQYEKSSIIVLLRLKVFDYPRPQKLGSKGPLCRIWSLPEANPNLEVPWSTYGEDADPCEYFNVVSSVQYSWAMVREGLRPTL